VWLFPSRQRFVLERLVIEDQALTSAEVMTVRDALQKLVLHFGTGAAPKKEKRSPKTSVPVVKMRPTIANNHAKNEAEHFVGALMLELPDLASDLAMKAYSHFCAMRDREIYRDQRSYALGAV
jgi:hypothetical protein